MMMPASLFYRTGGYTVGSIPFDLLISEHHSIEATVTEHPVESGAVVSDHVRIMPRKGSLVGMVTNYPLTSIKAPLDTAFVEKLHRIGSPGFLESIARQYSAEVSETLTAKDFEPLVKLTQGEDNRARTAWELFKELVAARQPVTIMTGVEKYADVIVTKVATDRDSGTGDSLRFSVEFQEITFVTLTEVALTATTAAPLPSVPVAKASKGKTGGKQVATPKVPVKAPNGSIAGVK